MQNNEPEKLTFRLRLTLALAISSVLAVPCTLIAVVIWIASGTSEIAAGPYAVSLPGAIGAYLAGGILGSVVWAVLFREGLKTPARIAIGVASVTPLAVAFSMAMTMDGSFLSRALILSSTAVILGAMGALILGPMLGGENPSEGS